MDCASPGSGLIDAVLAHDRGRCLRAWVISDLQQGMPEMIEECLRIAVDDILDLELMPDAIWYLGDATEGRNPAVVERSVAIQMELLGRVQAPVSFIMGNHDLDCARPQASGETPILPMWQAVHGQPGWRTTATCEDFFFIEEHGPWLCVFISDHIARDNRWFVNQNRITEREGGSYPHRPEVWQALRERIAAWPGPALIAGHYAYPGGSRGGPADGVHTRLLPLPDPVRMVLHGHSHIGDFAYGHEQCYRRLGMVDYQQIIQANVSSLDRTRGSQVRSAILDLYDDGQLALFLRDHEDRRMVDVLLHDATAPQSLSRNHCRHHSRRSPDLPPWIEQRIDKDWWLQQP